MHHIALNTLLLAVSFSLASPTFAVDTTVKTRAPTVMPQPKAPMPVQSIQSQAASQSVKPRIEHSVNRYAHGNQTITGPRLSPHHTIAPRHIEHGSSHFAVLGRETKATRVVHGVAIHGHLIHPGHVERNNGEGKSSGSSGGGGGGGGNFTGANGDGGGGGESAGAISSTTATLPGAPGAQARAFWNVVHSDFGKWNTGHDGRLTLPEMSRGLRNPAIKGDRAAALSALLVTMKANQHASPSPKEKYWSLEGLQKLVDNAKQTSKSPLISRYVQHNQALQAHQSTKTPLFNEKGPSPLDLTKGPTDNHAFLTVAAGLAHLRPGSIRSMISEDAKGVYKVRFPNTPEQEVRLTEGDAAEFASTGRNVVWADVLQKAHEQLTYGIANRDNVRLAKLVDRADVKQVLPLLTQHEVEVVPLAERSPAELSHSIAAAINDNRLVTLGNRENTVAVVGYDAAKDTVAVWHPEESVTHETASISALAKENEQYIKVEDLPKQFSTMDIETDKKTSREYNEILGEDKEEEDISRATTADGNAEDASIDELTDARLEATKERDETQTTLAQGNATDRAESQSVDLTLSQGSAFVAHENHVNIKTEFGQVHIAPHAAAYVLHLNSSVAVFNLSDLKSGQVSFKTTKGGRMLEVPVGQEIVVTNNLSADFEKANPDNAIAHRNVVPLGVADGVIAFRSEFSFTSLLDNAEGFAELVASNKARDKRIVKRLIKTAAIMVTLRPPFDEDAPIAVQKANPQAPAETLKEVQLKDAAPTTAKND